MLFKGLFNLSILLVIYFFLNLCIATAYLTRNLTDKMKRSFFQAAVVSILLYGCTTWTLSKRLEKKLDSNYTRMLRAILNRSWQQHPTRRQLYGHLPPITKTIQARRTRLAGHCRRNKDEIVSDVLLWTPAYGQSKAVRPARKFIQQLSDDTGCNPEDLPKAMNDRETWRERESQGYPCYPHVMMMMMMIYLSIIHNLDMFLFKKRTLCSEANTIMSILLPLSFLFRRCPWCNGFRRREWTRRLEFKSWTRLIAFNIALIPLGKV